ncbi:hypothetical protein JOF53_005139 [Crossiella equi]|uniref:Uncharacterized protein n=1 Tax=Crossiella equi TaxID=130796 RepID=A0ABS5AJ47_9PSEU|nr:DUF5336 domain-containing protein [Crossiella equi]MBP2476267.1 hypothetical protein [Crossiella equi]
MSVPYGAPPPQPQHQSGPPAGGSNAAGPNIGQILALVAAGLGLVVFFCCFSDDVARAGLPLGVLLVLASSLLTGLTQLPKSPQFLWVASVLSVLGTLDLLLNVTNALSVTGLFVVVLIAAVLQTGAVVTALLLDIGLVKIEAKPKATANPYAPPPPQTGGWNPPSGAMPQQQPPFGQPTFGMPPHQQQPPQQPQHGQFGAPPFGQQPPPPATGGNNPGGPEATKYLPHPGTPPSGFGGPQQG